MPKGYNKRDGANYNLACRVTNIQLKEIQNMAKKENMTVSTYLRSLIADAIYNEYTLQLHSEINERWGDFKK